MTSIYIETTIPNYYYEERPELAQQRDITRKWWTNERLNYNIYTSEIVMDELRRGNYPHKNEIIDLVMGISVLGIGDEVNRIAKFYVNQKLMPIKDLGDALHLAVVSYHEIDFLLTWNCRHLANPNKFRHIVSVNRQLNLFTPQIVTPDQLLNKVVFKL